MPTTSRTRARQKARRRRRQRRKARQKARRNASRNARRRRRRHQRDRSSYRYPLTTTSRPTSTSVRGDRLKGNQVRQVGGQPRPFWADGGPRSRRKSHFLLLLRSYVARGSNGYLFSQRRQRRDSSSRRPPTPNEKKAHQHRQRGPENDPHPAALRVGKRPQEHVQSIGDRQRHHAVHRATRSCEGGHTKYLIY